MANKTGIPVSPFTYDSGEDAHGRHVTIRINYDNVTRALLGAVLHRDAGCLYNKIYVGVGVDGRPDSTTQVFNIPNLEGDRNISAAGLAGGGLNVIEDVFALGQITAGP